MAVVCREVSALPDPVWRTKRCRIDPPSSLHKLDAESLAQKAGEENLFLAVEDGELLGCAFAKVNPSCVYVARLLSGPAARVKESAASLCMQWKVCQFLEQSLPLHA